MMPQKYNTVDDVKALVESMTFDRVNGPKTEDEYRANAFLFVLKVLRELWKDGQTAWGVLRKSPDVYAADVLVRRTPDRDMEVYDIVAASEAPHQDKTWIQHPNRTDVENWTSYEVAIYGTTPPTPEPPPDQRDDFEQLLRQLTSVMENEADDLRAYLLVTQDQFRNIQRRLDDFDLHMAALESKIDKYRQEPREIAGPFGLKGVLL